MIFRKLFLVFAVVAGLCAFEAQIENLRLPQVAQTELVVPNHEQRAVFVLSDFSKQSLFFVYDETIPVSSFHHYQHSLLIQTLHHHSSL